MVEKPRERAGVTYMVVEIPNPTPADDRITIKPLPVTSLARAKFGNQVNAFQMPKLPLFGVNKSRCGRIW